MSVDTTGAAVFDPKRRTAVIKRRRIERPVLDQMQTLEAQIQKGASIRLTQRTIRRLMQSIIKLYNHIDTEK